MKKNNYVWYLCYGSNLLEERFMYYIRGGFFEDNQTMYKGCTDKSSPLRIKSHIIHHEMYFAEKSRKWGNGGVCFLKKEEDISVNTYARMYLITEEQFNEVMHQEGPWYGYKLKLGMEEGYPIYSFTAVNQSSATNKPHQSYLDVIKKGLKQAFPDLDENQINKYLNQ
ncbi:MAG: hypothetical protein JXQ23_11245 [Clostridia bacterium]|nr:hypothetical protein [Clostridia bacterium]